MEPGVEQGWQRDVGERGDMLGRARFGASAPAGVLLEQDGFTIANVVARARRLLSAAPRGPHAERSMRPMATR